MLLYKGAYANFPLKCKMSASLDKVIVNLKCVQALDLHSQDSKLTFYSHFIVIARPVFSQSAHLYLP